MISVTEGLNTMDDGDDLIIGVRQLMNDYYARDIGNKIRHGYREKQKEGLVVKPPFGYWKDRNTGRIRLHPESSTGRNGSRCRHCCKPMPSPTVATPYPTAMPAYSPAVTAAAHSFQGFGAGMAAAG